MKEQIGIIGFGVLGKALKVIFEPKFKITIYDKYKKRYPNLTNLIKKSTVVFVAVPTPMKKSGEIDLSYVKEVLSHLSKGVKKEKKKIIVVLRSTIIPGTTDLFQKKYKNLKLVFNPEFLTEKNLLSNLKNTNRVVIGSNNKVSKKVVKSIYKQIFPKATYFLTNSKTAELIKYASNIMLASQIITANEIYQVSKKLGLNYKKIKNNLLLDKRIGTNITVPGNDGKLGFGGKCFPKDLNAFIVFSKKIGYNSELLNQIWKTNLKLRKEKDWEKIKGATSKNRFYLKG